MKQHLTRDLSAPVMFIETPAESESNPEFAIRSEVPPKHCDKSVRNSLVLGIGHINGDQ